MLYLHVSNRTENLLRHLIEVVACFRCPDPKDKNPDVRPDPFAKEYFLVQSQGMERIICQKMAEHFVSWCHFRFFSPMPFLENCATQLGIADRGEMFRRDILVWRIENLLRDIGDPVYAPLHGYISGSDAPLKRYQLAFRIAYLFDQYQMLRTDLLANWKQGRVAADAGAAWQAALWCRLCEEMPEAWHRGELLLKVIEALADPKKQKQELPPRLNVFGLSTMVPLYLKFLSAIARHGDVHLYVLSPCRHYWGDIARRRTVADESHPLLVSLGAQGRDFQQILFADDVSYEQDFASYENPLHYGPGTLLRHIQADLLEGEVVPSPSAWDSADDSLQIVACHSKIRELQVVKDHLLKWLDDDPDLELRDVVIMAPDIQEYAALIPAIFDNIPHSIADRSLHGRNGVIAAFTKYLDLFRGRFGWDEVFDLLRDPVIAETLQLGANDLDTLRHWIVASGIRWGLSAASKEQAGLPAFAESTWASGLERMIMGYMVASDDFVDSILPFNELEGGSGPLLGALCQFISTIEDSATAFSRTHSLEKWAALLLELAATLFTEGGEHEREFFELRELLASLAENAAAIAHHNAIDFRVIKAWLKAATEKPASSSGFLRGQLTFCSMLPMRSIPFKNVCLLGLNEGEFPRNDVAITFDLMQGQSRPGDRSRRMDDRYQFLEAVLAARDRLYISFVGQSIHNNDILPPAVVVAELVDLITNAYQVGDAISYHPLQPYSRRYFNGSSARLFSYDAMYSQVAAGFTKPRHEHGPWWQGSLTKERDSVSWQDLRKFYRHPQRWFVADCLGVCLRDDIARAEVSETFCQDALEKYLVNAALITQLAQGEKKEIVLRRLQAEGRWPLGASGALLFQDRVVEVEPFLEQINELQPGVPLPAQTFSLDVAGVELHGMIENIYQDGVFLWCYRKLQARDILDAWLHHLVWQRQSNRQQETVLLGSDGTVHIPGDLPGIPDLEQLVTLFLEGCNAPSLLYPEAGFAGFASQEKDKKFRAGMVKFFRDTLSRGYDLELAFLLGERDPETLVTKEVEELCETVLAPLWRLHS